jgi:hypothetical protein
MEKGFPDDLGELPAGLKDKSVAIQYVSPLARAQKMEDVAAMDRFEGDMAMTAQATQSSDVYDLYDMDAAKRMKAKLLGVPATLILDAKKVAQTRKAKEDRMIKAQQNAAAQAAMAKGQPGMAAAMPVMAPETTPDAGNPEIQGNPNA